MKGKDRIVTLFDKGYRVNHQGEAVSPRGVVLKTCNTGGYWRISTGSGNVKVHRLMAYQKYGEKIFASGIEVRHLDGNNQNNSYENIAIGTSTENKADIPQEIRQRKAEYAASFVKKHDHIKVYELHLSGSSYVDIMKDMNISSKGTVSRIVNKMNTIMGM